MSIVARRASYLLQWQHHKLHLGQRTRIMGVVNVTPDSFSDGGRFYDPDQAITHGERLVAEGADILDIGGESTRPFSDPVATADEIERVVPVIKALATSVAVPISIDTKKAAVAEAALAAGAAMINDISALNGDPHMASVAAEAEVPLVLMHMQGSPKTMQASPHYENLMGEVSQFLRDALEQAVTAGVQRERIILDPGIGFGKTFPHNLELLRQLARLTTLETPILVGASRKAFIRDLVKPDEVADIAADSPEVETGTQATVTAAILGGAHIVRVHDVANTRSTVRVTDAIVNAETPR
ncbi:MAG: dihydropteroate synthase [Desulfosarcinaceae bacterium]|nr:dihydropteroate synthase [Desulfosarcinaceae bacterium]